MKKIILTFILCLTASGTTFAQNNMEAMRSLTINALMQYGQKLYDRGDFNEACAVFDHVLTYDAHQVWALKYLKAMGHSPQVSTEPVVVQKEIMVKFNPPVMNKVDISDTEGMKKAIEAKKQVINKLRAQVMQMKANLASQSAE